MMRIRLGKSQQVRFARFGRKVKSAHKAKGLSEKALRFLKKTFALGIHIGVAQRSDFFELAPLLRVELGGHFHADSNMQISGPVALHIANPFGFQSERRTFWEAPEIYGTMSPFMSAHKLKTPILFIHEEADNNQGTFPIQSERMYQAVRGNGGTARLVMLPHESHGYSAKESIEHVLYEMITWFDKYVKNSQ